MNQHTIGREISLSGVGLHTGNKVTVTLVPADANFGIKFQRVDLENQPIVLSNVNKVYSTNRSTSLKQGKGEVITVEHLLSALIINNQHTCHRPAIISCVVSHLLCFLNQRVNINRRVVTLSSLRCCQYTKSKNATNTSQRGVTQTVQK